MTILTKRRLIGLCAGVLSISMLAACGGDDDDGDGDGDATSSSGAGGDICGSGDPISIPIAAGWDENIVTTHLWKQVLEEEGCEVEVSEMDIGVAFEGLAGGDQDMFLDTWLPDTHADYFEQYGDDMEELGSWYDAATLELAVPDYVDADSIEDLPDMADDLDGTIVGIDPGAGLTRITQDEVIPTYGLDDDFELDISSTATMLEQLEAATKDEEPIVVTMWHPHRAYNQFGLKDLEDPEEAFGTGEEIKSFGRSDFSEDYPTLAEAIGKWTMDDKTLMDLEKVALIDTDDPEEGVAQWIKDNPDYVKKMLA